MNRWTCSQETKNPQYAMGDEPPSLTVGTGVSAKYKGAFCEAKIRKVVRSVKCKVLFKNGLGSYTVSDDQIRGNIRIGSVVELRHPEKKEFTEATITKIQDCSQYTVVFDDGDITTLRRTALCLKSGKHFAESETLDQLPLTHPEHFSTPVIGGRRGRRTRVGASEASSDEDGASFHESNDLSSFKETDIGRVVSVEGAEKRKNRDNWFPALIVAPTAQESVAIRVREEYLVRSFKDGRYYTVPKKEILEFSPEVGSKAETNSLKTAVEKANQFIDNDELPLHWDRDLLLYGVTDGGSESDPGEDNEGSDDEPREKKDHFVAQLYKFMDENSTPINEEPVIGCKDVDLFRLYKVVNNHGGYNRVCNQNNWKNVSVKLGFGPNPVIVGMVKQCYKKYLLSFEACPKRSGCALQPRLSRSRNRVSRTSVVTDRSTSSVSVKIEKDKVADKVVGSANDLPVARESTSTGTKTVPLSSQKEIPPAVTKLSVLTKSPAVTKLPAGSKPPAVTKAPVVTKLPMVTRPQVVPKASLFSPTKGLSKKAAPLVSPSNAVPKAVNEPKTPAKEATGFKLRNPKAAKNLETVPVSVKAESKIEMKLDSQAPKDVASSSSVKEKKKRVITRVEKKEIPLVRGGKVDCLANTRQKRVIKERLKTVAESIKARTKSAALSIEAVEKTVVNKTKVKDEFALNVKGNKKEESSATALFAEEKRKGRKRKEKSELFDEHYDVLPTYKTISLGDKLKVYYGPTKEAKITSYEAKVLNIKEENGETLYLVHYTGWNTRYDEWIRANRVADNLSWVAGRASKKQAQVSAPKQVKKEKKSGKGEIKTEGKIGREPPHSASPCGSASIKDTVASRQGSVGRSVTPYSIASSSRSRGTVVKRPSTRAAQSKKDGELEEFGSDGGSDMEDSKSALDYNTMEACADFANNMVDITTKTEEPDDSLTTVKIEKEDDYTGEEQHISAGILPLIKCEDVKDEEEESVEVKEEIEENRVDEDDEGNIDDFLNKRDDKHVFEVFIQDDIKEESDDSSVENVPLNGFVTCQVKFPSKSLCPVVAGKGPTYRSASRSEDTFEELITVRHNRVISLRPEDGITMIDRSELKNGVIESIETVNSYDSELTEMDTLEIPMELEPDDVYEFREPEPFEFEARRSAEDRAKPSTSKRNTNVVLEDRPASPKVKSSPSQSAAREPSPQLTLPDLTKDDTSPESTPTIQTCEEAFDKMCASPLRAATLDSNHIALLGLMENYDDGDNFDDDSEDRLVISERESDNCSNGSLDKEKEANASIKPTQRIVDVKSTEQISIECKEDFPKTEDDDEDDDVEDEAINNAIQTAMSMETSDESSNEETAPDEKLDASITEVESLTVIETENTTEFDNSVNAESKDTIEEKDHDDLKGNEDAVESPENIEMAEPIVLPEPDKDNKPETIINDDTSAAENLVDDVAEKVEVENEDLKSSIEIETADPEEDENIESLMCAETIPGSPPSQLEVANQMDDKHILSDEGMFKSECEMPVATVSGEVGEPKHLSQVMRSPTISPESDESSTPSPSRESDNTSIQPSEKKRDKEYERNENRNLETSFKKDCGKTPGPSESRPKKSDVKPPSKRGRKSKKKSEEGSSRKKYTRHGKHQGSESDDGFEWPAGSSKSESSQSKSPHSNRQSFIISPDKLSALDSSQRIGQISEAMQNLRTSYNNMKAELTTIDKRRKRIKRREREDAARLTGPRSH